MTPLAPLTWSSFTLLLISYPVLRSFYDPYSNTASDRVVGFDINLDLMELLELSSEQGEQPQYGVLPQIGDAKSQIGTLAVSLGRYDFLTEICSLYAQHRKLMLNKGEALFHNYVGVVPRYHSDTTWHICLALALEIARSNNFRKVIAVTSSSIADQKDCEQLGFRKIGDLEYPYN